jgi:hypothetical protein
MDLTGSKQRPRGDMPSVSILYSGGTWFEAQLRLCLSSLSLHSFHQFPQEKPGVVPWSSPRPLPIISISYNVIISSYNTSPVLRDLIDKFVPKFGSVSF